MKNMDRVILGSVLLIGLGFGLNAQACTTVEWTGGFDDGGGNATTGSPPTISRLSGLCALKSTGQSHVQSNRADDSRYIGRFYVFDGLTGTGDVEIFMAFGAEDATGDLFNISYDGTQFTFDATAAGGTFASAASVSGKWNLVEFDWDSTLGTMKFWVNADAATDQETGSVDPGTGTVKAVRLGVPNGMGTQTGFMNFDTFESHRTTPVGPMLIGDANGDGAVNVRDYSPVQQDILGNLQTGQPDCNLDGAVNVRDYSCVQGVILGG